MAAGASALREVLREQPGDVDARTALALALYGMGDIDAAIEELRAILKREPDSIRARLLLATTLAGRQDWAGARGQLEEVLRRDPDLLQAHYTLGLVRYGLGDLPGAIESFRRVLAREPGHADAHENLGLILNLSHRESEAAGELLAAARAGLPRSQYFLGTAYATGTGVERDLARAVEWWFRAADQGVRQAEEALAQLRQVARGRGRRAGADRTAAEHAFRDFREGLWAAFPALSRVGTASVGEQLLQEGRAADAVPVLIREATALGEPSERLLETLYERGAGDAVRPHDARILHYFQASAAEGDIRSRIALAKIYAAGLGVAPDVPRAIALLRATPHEDAQRLLRELTTASDSGSVPARR